MTRDERRLLETLAGSADSTTDALLVAHGFDFSCIAWCARGSSPRRQSTSLPAASRTRSPGSESRTPGGERWKPSLDATPEQRAVPELSYQGLWEEMQWNRVEGNWKQVKGKVKEKWGNLPDDDLAAINGQRDQLEAKSTSGMGLPRTKSEKTSTLGMNPKSGKTGPRRGRSSMRPLTLPDLR
jgi:uncharacterized protein YjbJ (UPF0337 family)